MPTEIISKEIRTERFIHGEFRGKMLGRLDEAKSGPTPSNFYNLSLESGELHTNESLLRSHANDCRNGDFKDGYDWPNDAALQLICKVDDSHGVSRYFQVTLHNPRFKNVRLSKQLYEGPRLYVLMEADVCGYLEEVDTVSEVVEIPDRQQPHFSNIPSGFAGGGRPSPNSIGTNARVPSAGWRSAGMDGCLNPTGSGCLGATPGGCLYLPMRGCSLPGCGGIIAIVVLIYFILGLFGLLYNALSIGVFYLSPFLTQIITVGLGILLLVLFIGLLWVTISRGSSKTERIIAAIILIALLALMSIFFIGNLQPNNINLDFSDGQLLFISQSHLTLYPNL